MNLPDNVKPIEKEARFHFRCHAGLKCFTDCCRQLELALTPYDVLRLKGALKLSSTEFLERHAIVEFEEGDSFPRVYLGMVDDGKASCPYVRESGCLIYVDRPGACRTYPVGRGAAMGKDKKVTSRYVLLKEPHCHGFDAQEKQTIDEWEEDQQISLYNRFNDELMLINQHPKIRAGKRLNQKEADLYISTLYDLDQFKERIVDLPEEELNGHKVAELKGDDTLLLSFAIEWLARKLF